LVPAAGAENVEAFRTRGTAAAAGRRSFGGEEVSARG